MVLLPPAAQPPVANGLPVVGPARHGRGLFARRAYQASEPILRLSGIQRSGAELDLEGYVPGYPLQIDDDQYLLLDEPAVFANHSCQPNAGITPALDLIALTDIPADQEICFDYSTTMAEDNAWTLACDCQSPHCRGVVEDFERLDPGTQRYYLERGVVLGFILRRLKPA